MNNKPNNEAEKWNKKWNSANQGLTWVGRLMLRSKQKALREILGKLKISTAIDVGCGLGYMLSTFNDLNINAVGIDTSSAAVKFCQRKNLRAEKKSLEEVDDKYDLVFSDGLLEHFLNFEPLAKKMTEISNKYVLIIQTDHASFWGKTSIYFAELLRGSKNVLEYNYRIEDFVSVFKKHNFDLISNKKIFGGIFRHLLFRKDNS
jgi:SAM-dependent methyltransferase